MRKRLVIVFNSLAIVLFSLPAAAQGTGLVFLEPDRYRSIPLAPPTGLVNIPAEVDLSKDFPMPGNQGNQGSCVGWAVGYALKSYQERRERLWTDWDDTKRMSPAFIYNQIRVGGCGDGARIADALDLVTSTGAAAWADQPYSEAVCDDLPGTLAKQNAAMNRVAAWFRVNPQDRQAIRTSIAAGIPVVVGMRIDDKFKSLRAGETWRGGGEPAEAHAMVVVGYSDSRDAVKVINSWGTDWGDGGFGWIDFETFRSVTREAYVAQDVVLPVGMVERREHPYTVKTGPYGPEVFGLRLGMTKAQAEKSASRSAAWDEITANLLDMRSRYRAKIKAEELGTSSEILIDIEHDFLDFITVTLTSNIETDPFAVEVLKLLNALSPEAKLTLLEYKKDRYWFTPEFCELMEAGLEKNVSEIVPTRFGRWLALLDFTPSEISSLKPQTKLYCSTSSSVLGYTLRAGDVSDSISRDNMSIRVTSHENYSRFLELQSTEGKRCAVSKGGFYATKGPYTDKVDKQTPFDDCLFVLTGSRAGMEQPSLRIVFAADKAGPDAIR